MILKHKRHICLCAVSCLFGTVAYCRREDVWLPVLCILGAVLLYGISTGKKRKERILVIAMAAAVILSTFSICAGQDKCYGRVQKLLQTNPGTELSGTISKKEIKSDRCLYSLNTQYKKVIVYYDTDEFPIGSRVSVRGKWQAFSSATNEGEFDYACDYHDQNITFRVFADEMTLERDPAFRFREGLYQLQKRISGVFEDSLNEREAGVLSTLTVGNRGLLDPDVRSMYQEAGISHILAISGLHISILGYGVYRFLRKIRVPCHICELAGSGLMICFVIMCGMSVSAERALVMYLCLMGAHAAGRTYDPLNALAAAGLILLFPNPTNLYRSGFLFSFLALASIVLFQILSKKADRKKQGGFGISLKERFVFGAFLQLTMLPMTAWFYYEVPLYAVFLNFLLLPLCSILLGFGLAGGVLGIFFPQAAKWFLIPCHIILKVYECGIAITNHLPLHQWTTGKPSAWLLFFFYLSVACVCAFRLAGVQRRFSLLFPAALLAFILFLPVRQVCRIDFLDVAQGDGIFLADGAGTCVMIDGGSSTKSGVGTYEIEPFLKYHGIRSVDAWILTHGDADHYSGLLEILEGGYPVGCLLLADAMPRDETWQELVTAAAENETEVVYVGAGDRIALDGCEMVCLYPDMEEKDKALAGAGEGDANEFSQVWYFQKGEMSVLFTGDLGEEQERLLCERAAWTDCTVLKVAHHGSKYSSCTEFLEAVSPEYAVISCGEHNIYGHPAPETLGRLVDAGCEIYQTPQSGQITFYEKRGRWKLHTYLQ